MFDFIKEHEEAFKKALAFLTNELSSIHVGRAHPSMLDHVRVHAYDTDMRLVELGTISVPEPRVLLITLWDKGVIKDILASLQQARLDMQVMSEGNNIRLIMPHLTEERRRDCVKLVKEKIEKAKISIRQERDRVKELIQKNEKEKLVSQDEKFKLQKELDDMTHRYSEAAESLGSNKMKDVMSF